MIFCQKAFPSVCLCRLGGLFPLVTAQQGFHAPLLCGMKQDYQCKLTNFFAFYFQRKASTCVSSCLLGCQVGAERQTEAGNKSPKVCWTVQSSLMAQRNGGARGAITVWLAFIFLSVPDPSPGKFPQNTLSLCRQLWSSPPVSWG